MSVLKSDSLFPSALLTLSLALCIAWFGHWVVDDGWWPMRVAILAAGIGIAGGITLIFQRRRRRDSAIAERYFDALWRLDSDEVPAEAARDGIPSLPAENPWYQLAERGRETMTRLQRRIEELADAHTALEVRCWRATAEAERMRRILSGLADPILAIDQFDDLILANRSAEELLSLDATRDEAAAIAEVLHCQKLVQLLTSTRQRRSAGCRTDELEIANRRGESHWYRATAVKPAAADQEDASQEVGAVVVLRDIADQKALQKRNAEFVSSVSHEMKTPLAGIKAYVELLADGDAEDEATREEFLGVINSQADRLQRLIDNMLNLARIEAGVVNVNKQLRSLNEILEEALRVVQPAAEAKQIMLTPELSPLYLGVVADRDMLMQAAINLLSNAVKYTGNGGKVTLRSRLVDDHIRFEVQDTGVGLSEEDRQRVFEKFYRVAKNKEMAAGTGLGLPLAKHIIEDVHSGKLVVESTLGQGSTFMAILPVGTKDVY